MKIALGSDHRGTTATRALREHLAERGHEASVLGPDGPEPSDYPDQAFLVARAVSGGEAELGVLVCGSGIGMSIAANKVDGARAALACDAQAAMMSRRHNDANVLCLAADRLSIPKLVEIVDEFLATPFEGGRHARRVDKMAAIERGDDPAGCSREPAST